MADTQLIKREVNGRTRGRPPYSISKSQFSTANKVLGAINPTSPLPSIPVKIERKFDPAVGRAFRGKMVKLRHEIFIREYLRCQDAQKAYIKAGYKKGNGAYQLLNQLKDEIQKRSDEILKKYEVSAERIIQETAKLAFSNILDYIELTEDGGFRVNLNDLDRNQAAAICEAWHDEQGRVRIRLLDKKSALDMLAKYKKLFQEEQQGLANQPLTIAALDSLVQNFVINQQVNVLSNPPVGQLNSAVVEGQT